MVKGISRQVILVHSPDPKLFEQAIFILKDGQEGITDDQLLKEATRLINEQRQTRRRKLPAYGAFWACAGAMIMGAVWLTTVLL